MDTLCIELNLDEYFLLPYTESPKTISSQIPIEETDLSSEPNYLFNFQTKPKNKNHKMINIKVDQFVNPTHNESIIKKVLVIENNVNLDLDVYFIFKTRVFILFDSYIPNAIKLAIFYKDEGLKIFNLPTPDDEKYDLDVNRLCKKYGIKYQDYFKFILDFGFTRHSVLFTARGIGTFKTNSITKSAHIIPLKKSLENL